MLGSVSLKCSFFDYRQTNLGHICFVPFLREFGSLWTGTTNHDEGEEMIRCDGMYNKVTTSSLARDLRDLCSMRCNNSLRVLHIG